MTDTEVFEHFGARTASDAKPVFGNTIIYFSANQAGFALSLPRQTIHKWCQNDEYENWYYLSSSEYAQLLEKSTNTKM